MGMVAEHLDLSDEQKAQWKAIHQKAREAGAPLAKAAGEARQAFDKALEAENADAATVGQAALAMKNAQKNVETHHKATFAEVKAILTPEQLAKVEEMEKRGRGRGPGGPGFGGPGGPGGFGGPGGPGVGGGQGDGRQRGGRKGPRGGVK
jgi:Spy/CpxP family protein refolding chaperone